jgi:hypothetical protein
VIASKYSNKLDKSRNYALLRTALPVSNANQYSAIVNLQETLERGDYLTVHDHQDSTHISIDHHKSRASNISGSQYSNMREPVNDSYNSCKLQSQLPNLHEPVSGHKKLHEMDDSLTCAIPVTINGQVSSHKSDEVGATDDKEIVNCVKVLPVDRLSSKSSYDKEHKVLIIGDSYIRNCAENVKSIIKDNFDVQGFVKPGARTDVLVNSAKNYIKKLSKSDIIIFYGGVNDASGNK